jgi:hypothetical protein
MTTLLEIETAAETLPAEEQRELLLFLMERLRAKGPALPEPRGRLSPSPGSSPRRRFRDGSLRMRKTCAAFSVAGEDLP